MDSEKGDIKEHSEEKIEVKKHSEEKNKKSKKRSNFNFKKLLKNKWLISTIILSLALIVSIVYLVISTEKTISVNEVESLIGEFAQIQNLEIEEMNTVLESGVYAIKTKIGGQEFSPIYITKDGKYIVYGSLVEFEELMQEYSSQEGSVNSTVTGNTVAPEVKKTDKPVVELFVMTHCPYGTQAEKGFIPMMKEMSGLADLKIRFVHYFMHEPEYNETPVQICIREEQSDKFLDYLECFLEGDGVNSNGYVTNGNDPKVCMQKAGVDSQKVSQCVDNGKWEEYYDKDSELSQKYGVQGSPTLVINGVISSYGRSASSYLSGVCSAFNKQPEECSTLKLSSATPSVYFGWTTTTSTAAGAC